MTRPEAAPPRYAGWSVHDPSAPQHHGRDAASSRVLHFLRHGEALHQRRNAEANRRGRGCRCFDAGARPPDYVCPYWSEDLVDSPLTERGRDQTRDAGRTLGAELVLSSPMRRTLESAVLAFAPSLEIIALPALRARVGPHRHSKRSPRTALMARFPTVDFTRVPDDEDTRWRPHDEARADLEQRALAFLDFVFERPERHVAVLTHFTLFLALLLPSDDPWMLGPSVRPAGAPAILDCSRGARAAALRDVVAVGETRSLLVVREPGC